MTSGYILIVAILVLGGVLATVGDRVGTKVGKARLSLFNLRPRRTATVVTIITGGLISASTLGILFATSESLRTGIFELDSIRKKLRIARSDIGVLNDQKKQVEGELAKTKTEQANVKQRLDVTNQNFQQAQTQLKKISQQVISLRSEIKLLLAERQRIIQERNKLNNEISQLKDLVGQRDQELEEKNQKIALKNQELNKTNQELSKTNQELNKTNQELDKTNQELNKTNQEVAKKDQVIAVSIQSESHLKEAIALRENRLKVLEQELTQREMQLAERDKQLQEGEKKLAFLQQQVESLEQYYQDYQALRQGNVALLRGQVLSSGVLRIVDPKAATQAIDQLLREANRKAIEITQSSKTIANEPLVQIPQVQVDQLINQIQDGRDYVVRILSAGNYVEGEKQVQVFADAALNQVVFQEGDILATVSTDASTMTKEEIRQRLDLLLSASKFRARRAGILGIIQIGDGGIATIIRFIEELEKYQQPVDIKAVAQETTSTAGPLKMQLIAMQKGQVVFKT
jgi:uncharacterized protein (DUF3084 family)